MDQTRPLELLLVTGPLGSGKTTLVNRLLKSGLEAGQRMSLLINEFGETSIDGSLVLAERPELAGIESLVNGCACCSLRPEVVAVLSSWCGAPASLRPQRILLETTGLADPTDLVDLDREPSLQGRLVLAGCITVVSCLLPLEQLRTRELLRHQLALASLICISKGDLDPSQAMAWESEIRARHPKSPIIRTRLGALPQGGPDPWGGTLPEAGPGMTGLTYGETRALSLDWDHPVDPEALESLFLMPPGPGQLLRAKGVAAFQGWETRADGSDRWAFQVADGRVEIMPLPPLPDGSLPGRSAVIIGSGLDFGAWRQALRGLERPPAGARRRVPLKGPRHA
nr:CobW family GTP-binding protein [uncultured Holophaga sp.]